MTIQITRTPPPQLFALVIDQWTAPFWEAAKRHVLTIPQCTSCSRFRMPPGPFCPHCHSQEISWPELPGSGTIYSFTIVRRALSPEMESHIPYAPAVIELDGAQGCRLISNIVNAPVEAIRIGATVEVTWEDRADGVAVPRFVLRDEPS
jgi:uncharacterized protein